MPTYEYRCENGHDFEDFVLKISAAKPELPCPTCGVRAQRRVSAGGGLLFKGSGFYITDYGKDGKKPAKAAPAAGGSAKEGSDATATAKTEALKPEAVKGDAKPAAPPATTPAKGAE